MIQADCANPIPLASLLEYWLGELDATRETHFDEHLLGCGHCSANLQSLVDLAGEVRTAVCAGAVHAILPDVFLKKLAAQGMRVREYRIPHNGSIHCTIAPEDQLLVTHLDAPLAGIEQLDFEYRDFDGTWLERLRDVPFNAATGEVVFTSQTKRIRELPAVTLQIRLLAMAPSGEHVVGKYTLHHTPWRPNDSG